MPIVNQNPPFKLNISKGKEWAYYKEDIHKDIVSLSDPKNEFVQKAIEIKDHRIITCFDYDYMAFAVSRDVPIMPKEQTRGKALGEVCVKNKIDSKYIVGLIIPFSKEMLLNQNVSMIVDRLSEICRQNDFPLDIYNYEGDLLKAKERDKDLPRK